MEIRIEEILREIEILKKINHVLMERVERSIDGSGGDFALFEYNIVLQKHVEERTAELEKAKARLGELLEEQQRVSTGLLESQDRANRQRAAIARLALDDAIVGREMEKAMDRIAETLTSTMKVARAGVWVFSGDGAELRCLSLYSTDTGTHEHGNILETALFPRYFDAIRSEHRIASEDARKDPRYAELSESYLEPLGIISMLDSAIIVEGELKGIVCLEHTGTPRRWHADEENFLSIMASLIAQVFVGAKRKLAEDALIIFKESLENSFDAIGMATPEGKHFYQNRAFNELFGPIGPEPSSAYVDKKVHADVFRAISGGGVWTGEAKMYDREGRIRDILLRAYANRDDGGEITALVGVHTDITAMKKAEEALRDSEERLEYAMVAANDGLWDWNIAEGKVYFDSRYYTMAGYAHEAFPSHFDEWKNRVHPDDIDCSMAAIEAHIAGKTEKFDIEFRFRHGDGTWMWIRGRGKITERDESGRAVRMVGTHSDITARKKAEEALRISEQKFRNLYENLRDGSAAFDVTGKTISCNRQFLRMLGGYTFEEVSRLLHEDITPKSWHAMERNIIKNQVERRGYSDIYEKEYLRKDGSVIPVEIQIYLVKGPEGEATGYWAFVRDISERIRALEERERMQAQLVQSAKMESVGRLAGGVAHDFNNMLGVILGYSELALGQVEESHPVYAALREIQKAAGSSADLTRQLLAFARKQTVAPVLLDINGTVEGMLRMLRRLIGEDMELIFTPEPGIPTVRMDPTQVDQILANLCVNARDAITGAGRITIETGLVGPCDDGVPDDADIARDSMVMLSVMDNGRGMDRKALDHLFEPFYTTKKPGKGTGLGLATVYGIVKQNRGIIDVQSEPGRGTTIKIFLPACEEKEAVAPGTGKRQDARKAAGNETILLVEDEPAILNITCRMLEILGYTVISAGTPGEAIRLAREHAGNIHLLMTDVVMPEMNGRDLAKNLLTLYPDIRRLFMSGYTADVIAHHGVLDEGVHFIQKPFSMQDLASGVRKALDSK